eukprot:TRINITY_DN21706_c0_g1_i1.p1 TRINITY_DN21706_c0_g1~~TRINITY_DN21706_c0_g1_i1.p1  ORF type:complete len:303 (-),score=30.85 TRINITY_DN21706_c0_g1_i1:208-1089(-)
MTDVETETITLRYGFCGEVATVKFQWRSGARIFDDCSDTVEMLVDSRLRLLLAAYVLEGFLSCAVLCIHLAAALKRGNSNEFFLTRFVVACLLLASLRFFWAVSFLIVLHSLHKHQRASTARTLLKPWLWCWLLRISPCMCVVFMILYATGVMATMVCMKPMLDDLEPEVFLFFSALCFLLVANEVAFCVHTVTFPHERMTVMTAVRKSRPPSELDGMSEERHGIFPSQICAICLQSFEADSVVGVLPCGHVYHWECVHRWFRRDLSCPLKCEAPVAITFTRPSVVVPLLDEP